MTVTSATGNTTTPFEGLFAAAQELSHHLHMVAEGGMSWIGYWTHPYEPQDQPTTIVEIDSKGPNGA